VRVYMFVCAHIWESTLWMRPVAVRVHCRHVWHDSFICETWLIDKWVVSHIWMHNVSHRWFDSWHTCARSHVRDSHANETNTSDMTHYEWGPSRDGPHSQWVMSHIFVSLGRIHAGESLKITQTQVSHVNIIWETWLIQWIWHSSWISVSRDHTNTIVPCVRVRATQEWRNRTLAVHERSDSLLFSIAR